MNTSVFAILSSLLPAVLASSYHTSTWSFIQQLGAVVEEFEEETGRYPEAGHGGSWCYSLFWGRPAPARPRFPEDYREYFRSETNPSLSSRPHDLLAVDSWGNPLSYSIVGRKALIYSWGRNGEDDGGRGDDISNLRGYDRRAYGERAPWWRSASTTQIVLIVLGIFTFHLLLILLGIIPCLWWRRKSAAG